MLPKLDTPTYRLTLPSTKEEIQYRPFLVKEQKLLMMAQESENENEIIDMVSQIVNACTFEKIDVDTSPMFDIEYIFLQIRGKSVGEKIDLNLTCPDDEKTSVPVQVDINDISVLMSEEHSNEVDLNNDIKMTFRYPLLKDVKGIPANTKDVDLIFHLLNSCIESIKHEDETYNRVDISEKELTEFIDSLTGEQFERITEFFQTMPKLRHVIPVKNPKTEVESEVVVEGLASFLG
tara:strand:+ start:574 stop:1278 length:705 start_codon:yes stop_codon:yes gene_type:complete